MISYLIYSTICIGLVLLFYHTFLAREKMYQINRWYLLGGLFFSLTVPFMPVGVADSSLNLGSNYELSIPNITSSGIEFTNAESMSAASAGSTETSFEWIYSLLFCFYSIVTFFLFIRMIRHLFRMRLRSVKPPADFIKGHKIVLINDDVTPHTFWKTIFVNKEQYENGKIGEEVLVHELTHARQNHSLDILIIEFLKTIFWFNPILYFYKTAIQLNHELIADDKVLSRGADVADYQTLLLQMQVANPADYLSTALNFKLTKKRFKMMTRKYSTFHSSIKAIAIIPFFMILGFTFGCEPSGFGNVDQTENITLEVIDSETIMLNGENVSTSDLKSRFSDLSIDPENSIIHLQVHQDISMGTLIDVQEIIRNHGIFKINYSSIQ